MFHRSCACWSPNHFFVAIDCHVSICICSMLLFRNPDIFEDPESFIPSRWEHPTQEMNDAFNPFSLGKQNCLGQSLAKAEVR